MEIREGSEVVMVHTGDTGVVTDFLDADTVNVLLDDGFEIPAHIEDVRPLHMRGSFPPPKTSKRSKSSGHSKQQNTGNSSQKQSKNYQPNPQYWNKSSHPFKHSKPYINNKQTQKQRKNREKVLHPTILKNKAEVSNKGVLVGFETRYNIDGDVEKYKIYLINDTLRDVVFEFILELKNGFRVKVNGLSSSNTAFPLGELMYDELNEAPHLIFKCWATRLNGERDQRIDKTLKIKPKQFFKKLTIAPVLKGEAHVYELLPDLPALEEKNKTESLEEYTQRIAEERRMQRVQEEFYKAFSLQDRVHFSEEIDLHIEALSDNPKALKNNEKLQLQVKAFEEYIEKAILMDVERVYIIHGLGKGRLRDIVASHLLRNKYVATFNNNYHPKYGFGATEVIFKKDA